MHQLRLFLLIFGVALIFQCSCSGGISNTPTAPDATPTDMRNSQSCHAIWGLWQFRADPDAGTLEAVQLRDGSFHLNALHFLEPPPLVNLTVESVKIKGDIIDADIGLRHPFLGLTEFTGFDVCGIFITNGSITGFDDTDLRMAGTDNTHLVNPDGYSRWWNPTEFPINNGTMHSYQDGFLGTPDSTGDYNSTINPYKYYCDYLGPTDPLSNVIPVKRGMFSAGTKNIRHYTIKLGGAGLVFNYAVDACWVFPTGGSPWVAPDDFPPGANRPEAWRVEVSELENTLWNDGSGSGGNLSLSIDVYDWFNAALNTVKIESPGNFPIMTSSAPTGGGTGYSTYEIDIIDATPAEGSINLLISIESEVAGYGGLLPGKPVTAYFTYSPSVSGEPPEIIYVDDSNTSGIEDGTQAHPYSTIQKGIDAAPAGYTVLVDDSGDPYAEQVNIKSDIVVQSSNWDDSDGTGRALIDGPDDPETYSVYFNDVDNTTLKGFSIGFAGPWALPWPFNQCTQMIRIDYGSNITLQDCLFTGETNLKTVYPIVVEGAVDTTIANCRMDEIDRGTDENSCANFKGVFAHACNGLMLCNNIFTDIRSTEDETSKELNIIEVSASLGVIIKNNLIHHIIPHAGVGYMGAILMRGIYLMDCPYVEVTNNTVDNMDSSDGFSINQVFAYWLEDSTDPTFTDNIATHIYSSGFPPPLARGVQGVTVPVTCDFSDMYDIGPGANGSAYFGTATPGTGAIYVNPFYIDPNNENFELAAASPAQQGDPSFVDWDDTGTPSNDPANTDTNKRSRMGCHGGTGGKSVGLLS